MEIAPPPSLAPTSPPSPQQRREEHRRGRRRRGKNYPIISVPMTTTTVKTLLILNGLFTCSSLVPGLRADEGTKTVMRAMTGLQARTHNYHHR